MKGIQVTWEIKQYQIKLTTLICASSKIEEYKLTHTTFEGSILTINNDKAF